MITINLELTEDCENYIKLIEYLRNEGIKIVTLQPNGSKPIVSGSVLPDVVASEKKLREMVELHNPKVDNGKSDFYLAWRLCYEWMSGTDR